MFKVLMVVFSLWMAPGFSSIKGFEIDDKVLLKELHKVSGVDHPDWKELVVPEVLLDSNANHGKFLFLSGTGANDLKKYAYIGRVNTCRQGGCSNSSETLNIETPEYFDYLIVFDSKLLIQQVKVYNYQATHGQEVANKGWLKQFQGYDGTRSLTVGKSIDAISGATVSVYSLTVDIQERTRLLTKIVSK